MTMPTPEVKATMERLRQKPGNKSHDDCCAIYGFSPIKDEEDVQEAIDDDYYVLARAYIAEHADDNEAVTLDWMESVVTEDSGLAIGERFGVPFVWVGDQRVIIKSREQMRALLKGLGQ